jgi:hypothetical protein
VVTDPADVIREALEANVDYLGPDPNDPMAGEKWGPNPAALAALEDMQQRQAAKEPAGTYARITELQAINAQMTRHRDEQAARAVAAEAALADTRERAQRLYESYCETVAALADANRDEGIQRQGRKEALIELRKVRAALADANQRYELLAATIKGKTAFTVVAEKVDAEIQLIRERQRADELADHLADALSFAHPITGTDHDEEEAARAALDRHTTPAPEYHAEGLDERGIYGGRAHDPATPDTPPDAPTEGGDET